MLDGKALSGEKQLTKVRSQHLSKGVIMMAGTGTI